MGTPTGLVPIEAIQPGMLVLARDEANPQAPIVQRRVLETFVTHPTRLRHLTVQAADGRTDTFSGTPNHPFYSYRHGGFVEAAELAVGDTLSLTDGKSAKVTSVCDETALPGRPFTTYNFAVAEHHTYFVGESGIWVHNTGNLCETLTDKFLDLKKQNPDLTNEQLFKKLELEAPNLANGDFNEAQIQQHLKDVKQKLKTDFGIDIETANIDAPNTSGAVPSNAQLTSELDEINRQLKEGKQTLKPDEKALLRERKRQIEDQLGGSGAVAHNLLDRTQEAWREFQTNTEFRRWWHKNYKSKQRMSGGGRSNPDLGPEDILEGYDLWIKSGRPNAN